MKKFFSDFKDFAMKGNVVDMAVGVIIGGAFGKIVTSLVNDMLMPVIGYFTGGQNFSEHRWIIKAAEMKGEEIITPEVAVSWGTFVQTIVDFVIVAFCIFVMIRFIMNLKKKKEEEPAAPAEPSEEVKLLTEIRDALVKKEQNDNAAK
ncbi:MAG: large-conductance mechanosensitive channel protein MscL [Muribaculaceae bacterium]|nr:large-conductance mechanosensitive channel protein MscL [Muribaculaceae bacterium]